MNALCLFLFSCWVMSDSAAPWSAVYQAPLYFTIPQSLLRFMSIESVILTIASSVTPFSPPTLNLSQHQGLFQWVGSSHQVPKVLEPQLQHQPFQWIFRVDYTLGLTSLISLQSKGLSRVFSSTTIWKYKFFSAQPWKQISSVILGYYDRE